MIADKPKTNVYLIIKLKPHHQLNELKKSKNKIDRPECLIANSASNLKVDLLRFFTLNLTI